MGKKRGRYGIKSAKKKKFEKEDAATHRMNFLWQAAHLINPQYPDLARYFNSNLCLIGQRLTIRLDNRTIKSNMCCECKALLTPRPPPVVLENKEKQDGQCRDDLDDINEDKNEDRNGVEKNNEEERDDERVVLKHTPASGKPSRRIVSTSLHGVRRSSRWAQRTRKGKESRRVVVKCGVCQNVRRYAFAKERKEMVKKENEADDTVDDQKMSLEKVPGKKGNNGKKEEQPYFSQQK